MTTEFQMPSFRTKDMSDEFFFVARLKEHEIKAEERTNSTTGETFLSVQLHTIYEQLDREVPAARHSFLRIPQGNVNPMTPLGRYLSALETAGTPVEFGGGTVEDAQESVQGPIDTVYVCVQKSIGGRADTNPGRYVFPIQKIGYGNDWDAEEGARIIAEARAVSATGAGKTVAKTKAAIA